MKKDETQTSVVTTIRLPRELHHEIKEAARVAGHPMNDEMIARLWASPRGTSLADLARQNEKTQQMVQMIIDAIRPARRKPTDE
jgi:hypothetical protein